MCMDYKSLLPTKTKYPKILQKSSKPMPKLTQIPISKSIKLIPIPTHKQI